MAPTKTNQSHPRDHAGVLRGQTFMTFKRPHTPRRPMVVRIAEHFKGHGDRPATGEHQAMPPSRANSAIPGDDTSGFPDDYESNQFLDGVVLGWGLRNSVGVAEDPVTGNIYSVENSVDDVERDGQLIKEDNPGEELNLHGTIENASDSSPRNYGYPMCFAVWDADDIPNHDGLQVGDQFASDINSTLTDDICNTEYHKPRLAFPAHYAPLDARFNKDGDELFVSFHGSFNREDPHGYKLSTVEFNNGEPVKPRNSTDSLTDIVYMRSTDACPDNCFRPVGLAWDSKDRLFVTSDSTGEVFILERQSGSPTSDEAGTFVQPAQSGSTDGDNGSAASGVVVQTMGVVAAALCGAMLLSF